MGTDNAANDVRLFSQRRFFKELTGNALDLKGQLKTLSFFKINLYIIYLFKFYHGK